MKQLDQAEWVCHACWMKYGRHIPELATYHIWICGVCWEKTSVTQPRDYGYLSVGRKTLKVRYVDDWKSKRTISYESKIDENTVFPTMKKVRMIPFFDKRWFLILSIILFCAFIYSLI